MTVQNEVTNAQGQITSDTTSKESVKQNGEACSHIQVQGKINVLFYEREEKEIGISSIYLQNSNTLKIRTSWMVKLFSYQQ